MAEVLWPPDLIPSSQTWGTLGNVASFGSPFTRATRTYGRPGTLTTCTVTIPPARTDARARAIAALCSLRDRGNRMWMPDYTMERRGALDPPEMLTNGSFSSGSSGWSGNAGVSTISASDRMADVVFNQNNALNGPAIVNSSALTSLTQYAPYAFRAMVMRGRGAATTAVARIGTAVGDDDVAATSSSSFGMKVAAGVPASVASIYVLAGVGPVAGLVAGDYFSINYLSLSRCILVDGGGNLLLRSDQFDNATWTKTNASATSNAATAPDGETTADGLAEDTTTDVHFAKQSATVASTAADYCLTVAVKASGRSFVILALEEGTGSSTVYQYFNLGTGAVGATGATGANWANRRAFITSMGDGWYQCTVIGKKTNAATTVSAVVQIALADGTDSYLGASLGIYVWRATLAQSSVPVRLTQSVAAAVSASTQTGSGIYVKGLPASTQGLLYGGEMVQIGGQINRVVSELRSDSSGKGYLMCANPWRSATNDAPIIVNTPMCKMMLANDSIDIETLAGRFSPFQIELVEAID